MINNRQGGRRRGRGGQRPQGMPSRSDGNRQDNRQRGNAAQLLEKYKSMARDAQLAGDRVQTEYFLQFADHYFRVLGESRVRFEEQRRLRGDHDGDDDDGEEMTDAEAAEQDGESDGDGETVERTQRRRGRDRDERYDRSERQDRPDRQQRPERGERNGTAAGLAEAPERDERIAFEALPPAIGADDGAGQDEEASRPRRRARRPRAEDGEPEVAPAA